MFERANARPGRRKLFTSGRQAPIDRNDRARVMRLADESRRQSQFDALTTMLKDKDFALEMAAWQDGAYYRGQGKEPPPFLTGMSSGGQAAGGTT